MTGVDVRKGGAAVQLVVVVAEVAEVRAIEDETRRPDAASGAVGQGVSAANVELEDKEIGRGQTIRERSASM
ncbi:hypothetical protein F4782DRAFT_526015 [Xylaria castorea]|nr:hypothetical protein F4782DRAFT_526015 [Xylaria castorea]